MYLFRDYPVVCVRTMAKIAREAEACVWNERFFEDIMRSVCIKLIHTNFGLYCIVFRTDSVMFADIFNIFGIKV